MYVDDSYLTGALGDVVALLWVWWGGEARGRRGKAVTFASRPLVVLSVNQPRMVCNYGYSSADCCTTPLQTLYKK